MVKTMLVSSAFAFMLATGAQAGCVTGAVVGGVVGHMAGHHGMAGAAVGCAVGHHRAKEKQQANAPSTNNSDTTH